MTKGLVRACHKKSKLYKNYKISGLLADKNKFLRYRNKLKTILRKAHKQYYYSKFQLAMGDVRETWKIIGKLIKSEAGLDTFTSFTDDHGQQITDKNEIANKFNDYFVNIGSRLAATIPLSNTSFSTYLRNNYPDSICMYPTDANEITYIVSKFDNKVSYGHDCIPVTIMKESYQMYSSLYVKYYQLLPHYWHLS